jgi:hypothetical protein
MTSKFLILENIMCRMPSSGMLGYVALVRTDVLEEPSTSTISVTRIGELWTLAATSNQRTLRRSIVVTLMMEALGFSENVGSYKSHIA